MTPHQYIDHILLPFVRAIAEGNTSPSFYAGWAKALLAYPPEVAPAEDPAQPILKLARATEALVDANKELADLRRERNDAVHVIRSLQSIAKSFHTKDNRP